MPTFQYALSAPRALRTAASPHDADAFVCECIRKHLETFLSEDLTSAVIDLMIRSHYAQERRSDRNYRPGNGANTAIAFERCFKPVRFSYPS